MSEIELVDKKSFSSEEVISDENSENKEINISQKKSYLKPALITIFIFFVIFSLIMSYHSSITYPTGTQS